MVLYRKGEIVWRFTIQGCRVEFPFSAGHFSRELLCLSPANRETASLLLRSLQILLVNGPTNPLSFLDSSLQTREIMSIYSGLKEKNK